MSDLVELLCPREVLGEGTARLVMAPAAQLRGLCFQVSVPSRWEGDGAGRSSCGGFDRESACTCFLQGHSREGAECEPRAAAFEDEGLGARTDPDAEAGVFDVP